jgi:hypothetical protein
LEPGAIQLTSASPLAGLAVTPLGADGTLPEDVEVVAEVVVGDVVVVVGDVVVVVAAVVVVDAVVVVVVVFEVVVVDEVDVVVIVGVGANRTSTE